MKYTRTFLKRIYKKNTTYSYSVFDESFGAIEFQYMIIDSHSDSKIGGVERHYLEKQDYMSDNYPCYHESCEKNLGKKCWHDGSSLAADRYYPLIGDEEAIFRRLESEMDMELDERKVEKNETRTSAESERYFNG